MPDRAEALEDLRIIRTMIDRTRHSAAGLWAYVALWGVGGILAACVSQAMHLAARPELIWIAWVAYTLICGGLTVLRVRADVRQVRMLSFADRVLVMTWGAVTVTVLLLYVAAYALLALSPELLGGIIAWMIALALVVTATVIDWRPLLGAAGLWWIGGLGMLLLPDAGFVLTVGLMLVAFLWPAYVLRQREQEETGDGPAAGPR